MICHMLSSPILDGILKFDVTGERLAELPYATSIGVTAYSEPIVEPEACLWCLRRLDEVGVPDRFLDNLPDVKVGVVALEDGVTPSKGVP